MHADYRDDLAYIHDAGFGGHSLSAAEEILRLLRKAGNPGATVVDLGCGSGIWLRELCHAGYYAVGIDSSTAMLNLARRAAPEAELIHSSIWDATLPDCDVITAFGEVLNYSTTEGRRPPPVSELFRRVGEALPPGGLFIFDLLVESRRKPMSYRTWRAGEDWAVLVDAHEDIGERLLYRDITTFRLADGHYRRDVEQHILHVYSRDEIKSELRRSGFSVVTSRAYGNSPLPPRRLAFRARRQE